MKTKKKLQKKNTNRRKMTMRAKRKIIKNQNTKVKDTIKMINNPNQKSRKRNQNNLAPKNKIANLTKKITIKKVKANGTRNMEINMEPKSTNKNPEKVIQKKTNTKKNQNQGQIKKIKIPMKKITISRESMATENGQRNMMANMKMSMVRRIISLNTVSMRERNTPNNRNQENGTTKIKNGVVK
jgi:hypothetical protein